MATKSRLLIGAFLLVALLLCNPAAGGSGPQMACPDVGSGGNLDVLTINLLASDTVNRAVRFERLTDYLIRKAETDPVDVILLQEVVGGTMAGTPNSAGELQSMLAARGVPYNLAHRLADGAAGSLSVGNAILSRCRVDSTSDHALDLRVTDSSAPLPRTIMMSRIEVPVIGYVNVYNTQLCESCDPVRERWPQAKEMMEWIRSVEAQSSRPSPAVLGGSFNMNLNLTDASLAYNAVKDAGFRDTYADLRPECTSCCDPAPGSTEGIDGCTYDVRAGGTRSPYLAGPDQRARIDLVFDRNLPAPSSAVVLPPPTADAVEQSWVSDHSAVLVSYLLP